MKNFQFTRNATSYKFGFILGSPGFSGQDSLHVGSAVKMWAIETCSRTFWLLAEVSLSCTASWTILCCILHLPCSGTGSMERKAEVVVHDQQPEVHYSGRRCHLFSFATNIFFCRLHPFLGAKNMEVTDITPSRSTNLWLGLLREAPPPLPCLPCCQSQSQSWSHCREDAV